MSATLIAFYDLEHGPVSFDFVTWLVRAMKEQVECDCERLHIVIVPKENGLGGFSRNWGKHDEHAARWRLWHIMVAACPLAGATVTVASTRSQAEDMSDPPGRFWWPQGKAHFMGPLVTAARRGEAIPKLRATEAARRYVAAWLESENATGKTITLTMRKQDTDPGRNSDVGAWYELDNRIRNTGRLFPVLLDDTNEALAGGRGYAELDPDLRLALYEQAAMNFIGNNGPQELLKFSAAPYRIVGLGLEEWREHFRKYFHMEYGQQLPWAGPQQRLVYEPDTFEVLKREFEAWASATS
jgi:hypothetical protein